MKNFKTVYIAFGSNKGDSTANINKALNLVREFCNITKVSPLFITKPEGFLDQPDFINGVFEATTNLTPEELLKELEKIEVILGRQESFRNAPREIDLDIVFYDQEIINTPSLTIPHKAYTEREFVLATLAKIAPDFTDPISKKSISFLLQELMLYKKESTVKEI